MQTSHVNVLAVAPYEGMKSALEHAASAFPDIRMDVVIGDLEEGVARVTEREHLHYDAIISRGGTAEMISKVASPPVVEIEISMYDILRAIKLAENYNREFAVVGFPGITEPAHVVCNLLRVGHAIYTVHSAADAQDVLERLNAKGIRLILCDMVVHTAAQRMGFDAFLITSGAESMHNALVQAATRGEAYRLARLERDLLTQLVPVDNHYSLVLETDATVRTAIPTEIPEELLHECRSRLPELTLGRVLHTSCSFNGLQYAVTGRLTTIGEEMYALFTASPAQIQLRSGQSGVRTMRRDEIERLFMSSFYAVSGAMGETEQQVNAVAHGTQPVMIVGEVGTGKEQIARLLFLRSSDASRSFIVVNCRVMDDRGWDYLFSHHHSPLSGVGSTVYFQHLQDMPAKRQSELLSLLLDTNLAKRQRLIFSCACLENSPLPPGIIRFMAQLGCMSITLPTLRSRSDEIPSLAILYLNNLNYELGMQVPGFDPQAIEQLKHYDWPHNYTQFKKVLREATTLNTSVYIPSSLIADLLIRERAQTRSAQSAAGGIPVRGRSLDQITQDAVLQVLSDHKGNHTAAAKQLGISRSTLWRYTNRMEDEHSSIGK